MACLGQSVRTLYSVMSNSGPSVRTQFTKNWNISNNRYKIATSICCSECGFADPFRFKIRFNCIEDLQEDLDWKVLYVGSANSCEFDQGLIVKTHFD